MESQIIQMHHIQKYGLELERVIPKPFLKLGYFLKTLEDNYFNPYPSVFTRRWSILFGGRNIGTLEIFLSLQHGKPSIFLCARVDNFCDDYRHPRPRFEKLSSCKNGRPKVRRWAAWASHEFHEYMTTREFPKEVATVLEL